MYKYVIDFLVSRQLTVWLFICIVLLSGLGTIIPQEHLASADELVAWQENFPFLSGVASSLGLTSIYFSFPYVALNGLVCAALLFCTFRRILSGTKVESVSLPVPKGKGWGSLPTFFMPSSAWKVTGKSFEILRKRGFAIRFFEADAVTRISASKQRLGIWGSHLFHLSLTVLFIGALISVWTRFEGRFLLTEGQVFHGNLQEYSRKNNSVLLAPKSLPFSLKLIKFSPSGAGKDHYPCDEVLIKNADGSMLRGQIRQYHALSHAGFTFYRQEHGFSPSFRLESPNGSPLFHAFVAFKSQRLGENFLFEDLFEIPAARLRLQGTLYPDAVRTTGQFGSLSNRPRNPVMALVISRGDHNLFSGTIALGQTIALGEYTLSFDDLRYWSSFRVVRDYGLPVIYAGFFLAITGLVIRIFCNRQQVLVEIEALTNGGSGVTVHGRVERERAFFTERLQKLVEQLKTV